ncbi:MAG: methyltransferase [Treponema sp.]|jgi:23S rRNA (uracil1939-C5)-methyltransferase|nr:methyltransferase [Treponema sp.]
MVYSKYMVRDTLFTAPVERISTGGAGVLHFQGQCIFVDYTVPGDLITGRITGEHKGWAQGELVEILEPSPQRRTPVCEVFGACGACSLQHLAYETQIAEKVRILQDSLVRIGGLALPPEPKGYPAPPLAYRNRVQFHCIRPFRRGSLGFKSRSSASVIPLKDCPVADPGIRQALQKKEILPPPGQDRFTVYSRFKTFLSEGGLCRGRVSLLDRELLLDAGVFFQSNGIMLEILIQDLRRYAQEADASLPMADLYCGVGTFAAFLQDLFPRMDLVEQSGLALALARENVPGKGIRYAALSSDHWVKTLSPKARYGFMVVDPPRQGLSRGLRQWLVQGGPPLLAYISCDPATLARDSRVLLQGGYELREVTFYDFYPQTAHIESLGIFTRDRTLHGA